MFATRGVFEGVTLEKYREVYLPCKISMTSRDSNELSAAAGYSAGGVHAAPCVVTKSPSFPRDIVDSKTSSRPSSSSSIV